MNRQVQQFLHTFNEKQDYIACHNISRDMLSEGDKQLAKTLATLSALVEQVKKERWSGYHKLYPKLLEQLNNLEAFPFDRKDLKLQLNDLDKRIKQGARIKDIAIQLKTR